MNEELKLAKASAEFGITRAYIGQLIRNGLVAGYRTSDGSWLVNRSSLATYLDGRPKRKLSGPRKKGEKPARVLCACGCGQITRRRGWEDRQYLKGHHFRRLGIPYEERESGFSTPCWIWQRTIDRHGYALMHHDGRTQHAYRVYYGQAKGLIPTGLELDHLCRNRACINPDHLEPVTSKENVHRGKTAKLTVAQVEDIRNLSAERGSDLARRFGVSPQTICDIRKRRKWIA